jgi:excisionase family DNA binding protein
MQKYLSVTETAYLNTSERFVRRLIAERRIAFHHLGRHVLFALSDLDEWLLASRVEPITTTTVRYRLMRAVLNTAVDDGRIKRNPCRIKGAGEYRADERPTASVRQVYALAERMPERFRSWCWLRRSPDCGGAS